jgi:hypothetical protein
MPRITLTEEGEQASVDIKGGRLGGAMSDAKVQDAECSGNFVCRCSFAMGCQSRLSSWQRSSPPCLRATRWDALGTRSSGAAQRARACVRLPGLSFPCSSPAGGNRRSELSSVPTPRPGTVPKHAGGSVCVGTPSVSPFDHHHRVNARMATAAALFPPTHGRVIVQEQHILRRLESRLCIAFASSPRMCGSTGPPRFVVCANP